MPPGRAAGGSRVDDDPQGRPAPGRDGAVARGRAGGVCQHVDGGLVEAVMQNRDLVEAEAPRLLIHEGRPRSAGSRSQRAAARLGKARRRTVAMCLSFCGMNCASLMAKVPCAEATVNSSAPRQPAGAAARGRLRAMALEIADGVLRHAGVVEANRGAGRRGRGRRGHGEAGDGDVLDANEEPCEFGAAPA